MKTMTRTAKQRQHLIRLLDELFQLDQPDLDFGFYKIMHAKAQTVSDFLQDDLLKIIQDAFGKPDENLIKATQLRYERAIETAKEYDVPIPEATVPVKKAKAAVDDANSSEVNEGDIYEHLCRFFDRYYDNADFMSRRYFIRETEGCAAPYAVPYDGREVYLHWANRDQYYIKTSEHLNNFTFDIAQELAHKAQRELNSIPEKLKLHCRIIAAKEGEHNNNKASDKTERFFLIHREQSVLMENGELVLQFEYRPDGEKPSGKQTHIWQTEKLDEAEEVILQALAEMGEDQAQIYHNELRAEITDHKNNKNKDKNKDNDKDKNKRTLLRKYLIQYTKRNTTDYFIHKDLGSFLKRELDFYIKNEIMQLDDIESADAVYVDSYLNKIKVLRKIAKQLITFLAQLEDFQKKLWLKKKFVTDTQYCITLDRVPESFYAEIANNKQQQQEWVSLFAIDELDGYATKLNAGFLKNNPFLVLDTACFTSEFKDSLLAEIEALDENMDGLLIHSENFQALGLMQEKYKEQVKCVHIDPPYNTNSSGFVYKNNYQHSSWISMMENRLSLSINLLNLQGSCLQCHIDENEYENLFTLIDNFNLDNQGTIIWDKANPLGGSNKIASQHEYIICQSAGRLKLINRKHNAQEIINKAANIAKSSKDINSTRHEFKLWIRNNRKLSGSERGFNELDDNGRVYQTMHMGAPEQRQDKKFFIPLKHPITNKNCPVPDRGWSNTPEFMGELQKNNLIHWGKDETTQPRKISYMDEMITGEMSSVIRSGARGKKQTDNLGFNFPYCHHSSMYEELIFSVNDNNSLILDYFAGSGTTGHAVVNLNREDGGKRKYIMVEMGSYFDTVTKPRMQKVVYSTNWKDGKPVSREGISHAFKYIRLESYEDTLNNLVFKDDPGRQEMLKDNDEFRCDYMLNYWLDFETKGSPSLLNIKQFHNPNAYQLKLKKPNSNEYEAKTIDLVETFNWLIGLYVCRLNQWRSYSGKFYREEDSQLPQDQTTRLLLDGNIKENNNGKWHFRNVTGRVCRTSGDMNNTDSVLIIWRKLTDNLEEDNLMLDEWFKQYRLAQKVVAVDIIYVNGSNNLQLLCQDDEHWQVQMIEEVFHQKMWDTES